MTLWSSLLVLITTFSTTTPISSRYQSQLTEEDVELWTQNDVERWLRKIRISEDGIDYLTKTAKIADGASLLFLDDDDEHKDNIKDGMSSYGEYMKFKHGLDALIKRIESADDGMADDDQYDDEQQYDQQYDQQQEEEQQGLYEDEEEGNAIEAVVGDRSYESLRQQRLYENDYGDDGGIQDLNAINDLNQLNQFNAFNNDNQQQIPLKLGVDTVDNVVAEREDEVAARKYSMLRSSQSQSERTRNDQQRMQQQRAYGYGYGDNNNNGMQSDGGYDANSYKTRTGTRTRTGTKRSRSRYDDDQDTVRYGVNPVDPRYDDNSINDGNFNPNLIGYVGSDGNDGVDVVDGEYVNNGDDDEDEEGLYREQDLEDLDDINDGDGEALNVNVDEVEVPMKRGYSKQYEESPMMKKYYDGVREQEEVQSVGYGQIEQMEEEELREEEEVEKEEEEEIQEIGGAMNEYIGDKLKAGISNFNSFDNQIEREDEGQEINANDDGDDVMDIDALIGALGEYCTVNGEHPICGCLEGVDESENVINALQEEVDDGYAVGSKYGRESGDDDVDYGDIVDAEKEGDELGDNEDSDVVDGGMDALKYKYRYNEDGDDDEGVAHDDRSGSGYVPRSDESESSGLVQDGVEPPRLVDMEQDKMRYDEDQYGDNERDDIDAYDVRDDGIDDDDDSDTVNGEDNESDTDDEWFKEKGMDNFDGRFEDENALNDDDDDLDNIDDLGADFNFNEDDQMDNAFALDDDRDGVVVDDDDGDEMNDGGNVFGAERGEEGQRRLSVSYNVEDAGSDSKTLSRRIVFAIDTGGVEVDGLWYLKWCAVGNMGFTDNDDYCASTTFTESEPIQTTLFPQIAYRFEIRDEDDLWKWDLDNFIDDEPSSGSESMEIEIAATILSAPSVHKLEITDLVASRWKLNGKTYRCSSSTPSDMLMAERIRSILFKEHSANNVQVSLKLDANSFSSGSSSPSSSLWSPSVWIWILCLMALCGAIAFGVSKLEQSGFAYRTLQDVIQQISKWTGSASSGSSVHFETISMNKMSAKGGGAGNGMEETDRELTVNTASTPNSAEQFLLKTFQDLGTPSFITTKYIKSLRDDHVTSIERLRNFDDADWRRHGVKDKHIAVLRRKLMEDDDDDEEEDENGKRSHHQQEEEDDGDSDELSFSDDDDGWNGSKTKGGGDDNGLRAENNESTTDFDDF